VDIDYSRQKDVIPVDLLDFPVTVVGAGGIGSPVALALAKMGVGNLQVIDFDKVELHNCPNQLLYPPDGVGELKVVLLQRELAHLAGVDILVVDGTFPDTPLRPGVVISAVDSMAVRSKIWQVVKLDPNYPLFIDGRMDGEDLRVYTINPVDPDHIKFYEASLYGDEGKDGRPCTNATVIYNCFVVGGIIASRIAAFARHETGGPKEFIMNLKTLNTVVDPRAVNDRGRG
jgi:adenylyltransferase/sulfurtransferase